MGLAIRVALGGVSAGAIAAALTIAAPATADTPGYYGYYGLAAEYPVGACIDIPNNIEIDVDQLKNLRPISCDHGARDYRVVQQAATEQDCTRPVDDVFFTTDGVVLCVVQDY
jgi:hypothetical protein